MTTKEHPELSRQRRLSEADMVAIRDLATTCNRYEDLNLKLNWDMLQERPGNVTDDFLFWREGTLIGYLGLYGFGRRELELNGMVHPDWRRQGVFRQLFAAAQAEAAARDIERLLLICDLDAPSGQGFVRAVGAEYTFAEHMMEIAHPTLLPLGNAPIQLEVVEDSTAHLMDQIRAQGFGTPLQAAEGRTEPYVPQPHRRDYLARLDGEPIGVMTVYVTAEEAFIYGFTVVPEQRNRGYGRQILAQTVNTLVGAGDHPIKLEVETQNQHALGLYESCGFQRVRTYEYWNLPVRR